MVVLHIGLSEKNSDVTRSQTGVLVMIKPDRIELLKQRKAKIERELSAIEAKEKAKTRKEETRLKVLIGGGILADAKVHPEMIELVQEILTRATTAERDRELLKSRGWIK